MFNILNNFYGWAVSIKLQINNFEQIEDTSQFHEDFLKKYNEENDGGYFLEVEAQYLPKLRHLYIDLPFFPRRMRIEKV